MFAPQTVQVLVCRMNLNLLLCYLKIGGIALSTATVANAGYEYATGEITGSQLAITTGVEAANVFGGFGAKPVEVLVTSVASTKL
jgi:hypothetical protein